MLPQQFYDYVVDQYFIKFINEVNKMKISFKNKQLEIKQRFINLEEIVHDNGCGNPYLLTDSLTTLNSIGVPQGACNLDYAFLYEASSNEWIVHQYFSNTNSWFGLAVLFEGSLPPFNKFTSATRYKNIDTTNRFHTVSLYLTANLHSLSFGSSTPATFDFGAWGTIGSNYEMYLQTNSTLVDEEYRNVYFALFKNGAALTIPSELNNLLNASTAGKINFKNGDTVEKLTSALRVQATSTSGQSEWDVVLIEKDRALGFNKKTSSITQPNSLPTNNKSLTMSYVYDPVEIGFSLRANGIIFPYLSSPWDQVVVFNFTTSDYIGYRLQFRDVNNTLIDLPYEAFSTWTIAPLTEIWELEIEYESNELQYYEIYDDTNFIVYSGPKIILKDTKLTLFSFADQKISLTGGWVDGLTTGGGSVSIGNNLEIQNTTSGQKTIVTDIKVKKPFHAKFLKVKWSATGSSTVRAFLAISTGTSKTFSRLGATASVASPFYSFSSRTDTLDISSIQDDFYISILGESTSGSGTLIAEEIWFEE
jgi:hypothetical protein